MNKVVWLTGLPCSGKTTIGKELNKYLDGIILDGDIIRSTHISQGLNFTRAGRTLNILRIADIANIMIPKTNVICSFISPYREIRDEIRKIIGKHYIEIYVKCSLQCCIKRDVKGMYAKAMNGDIKNFTGIDDPYDIPNNPDIIIDSENNTIIQCIDHIIKELKKRN